MGGGSSLLGCRAGVGILVLPLDLYLWPFQGGRKDKSELRLKVDGGLRFRLGPSALM